MNAPEISVIVPCYNKAPAIAQVLQALMQQDLPSDTYEVLIVDDGSTDGTETVIAAMALPESFRHIRQENQGASVARNQGARKARGTVLLFLDGDVIAGPALLEQHLRSHAEQPRSLVIGRLRNRTEGSTDLFDRIVRPGEWLDHGPNERALSFTDAFSGNMSVARQDFHRVGCFDEDFAPDSGYEDTEFAYRAVRAGLSLVYNPEAVGSHPGSATFAQACQRARNYQRSAVLLMKKHPELVGRIPQLRDKEPLSWRQDDVPLVVRKLLRQALAWAPALWAMKQAIAALERWYPHPTVLRFLYHKVLSSYLLLGFRDGIRRYGWPAPPGRPGVF